MTATLCIHIGHYKTGTTALQVFAHRNPGLLAGGGVAYAEGHRHLAKHSAYAFSLLRAAGAEHLLHGYADPTPPEELWRALFGETRRNARPGLSTARAPTTLISSEEFMRLAEFPEAAARLAGIVRRHGRGLAFRILVWLRPPGAHLESWCNQLVKMGQTVPGATPALTGHVEAIHHDYAHALAPWAEIFGRDAVEIRRYPERRDAPGALLAGFLGAFGLGAPAAAEEAPGGGINPRLDARVAEAVRMLQNAGLPAPAVRNARNRMARFVAREDALAPAAGADTAELADRAAAGIDALAGLGRADFDTAALKAELPGPHPGPSAEGLLAGFALAELVALRRRVNPAGLDGLGERLDGLAGKVERLEARLAGSDADAGSDAERGSDAGRAPDAERSSAERSSAERSSAGRRPAERGSADCRSADCRSAGRRSAGRRPAGRGGAP